MASRTVRLCGVAIGADVCDIPVDKDGRHPGNHRAGCLWWENKDPNPEDNVRRQSRRRENERRKRP